MTPPSSPAKKTAKKTARKQAKQPGKQKSVPQTPLRAQNLEGRVTLLENQVRYLMEKMTILDAQNAPRGGLESPSLLEDAKSAIRALFKPGESRSIDEVFAQPPIKRYPPEVLDRAVIALIDEETFDVSEGTSKLKVQGYIARLIRR